MWPNPATWLCHINLLRISPVIFLKKLIPRKSLDDCHSSLLNWPLAFLLNKSFSNLALTLKSPPSPAVVFLELCFPENSIEIQQVVQKISRFSSSILAIFGDFLDFLTFTCCKEIMMSVDNRWYHQLFSFKGTVIKIKRGMINDRLHVSKVSWKFCIPTIYNFAVILLFFSVYK